MSNCVITNGLQLNSCANNVPGLDGIWVLTSTGTTDALASITYDVIGMVDALSGATAGLEFKKVDIVRNSSAALNEETSINLESLGFSFNPTLIFTIPGYSQENTNLYQEIVKNTASFFIVKLKTGRFFFVSPSGLFVSSATIGSGSLPGDSQLYTLTLTGNESISIPEMDITTTLTAWLAANSNIAIDREN